MLNTDWKKILHSVALGVPWLVSLAPSLVNAQGNKPNVLVLVLDQLRADELHWTEGGDGARTALWRGDSPLVGKYKVSVYTGAPKIGALATNAQYKIVAEHTTQTVTVNLQLGAGEWRPLGTFDNPRFVELSNAANGIVIADAVRFERIE